MEQRLSLYQCANGHKTITADPGNVILPMIMDCQECREIATLVGPVESGEPTHEWYIPEKRRGLTKEDNRRYKKHGVYLKKINNEKEVIKADDSTTKQELGANDYDWPWTDDDDPETTAASSPHE